MSTLKADTIQSTGGGPVTLTKIGTMKHFAAYDLTSGSGVAYDSLNNSSFTDIDTGQQRLSYTNNFATAKGRTHNSGIGNVNDLTIYSLGINPVNESDILTSSIEVVSVYTNASSNAPFDYKYNSVESAGDLA
jgi:hypothetical protein